MLGIAASLAPGGRLVVCVPNAESPLAATTIYCDLTHEHESFTAASLEALFYCHGLRSAGFRDPFPAPVSPLRRAYRCFALLARRIEALRIRALGLQPPRFWSPVLWAMGEKE